MKPKILIAVGVLAAFLAGAVFEGFVKPQLANALATTPPVMRPVVQRVTTERVIEREVPAPRRHRSWEREVLIVAGSSGAGAAIGGAAKGARGAAVGALAGGVAGLIYDLATRNR
jgi:hypothetical protein